ncbi:hypothetical protein BB559_000424 [Furculomyces boomerangus]|uniref:HIG1 domain-containing protein n=1 Tax=Furculomyces boomerangus TaxID=61424 RepID=A0A2T9Z5F3_9FUNG|nr:hypothetical protein BB559_000424 [Furculomyces boomerangus]
MKETASKKISRRLTDEPLVVAGVGLTTAAFMFAAYGIYKRNANQSQWGMRLRVLFQGLTVSTLVWYAYKASKSEERENPNVPLLRDINWAKIEQAAKEAEKNKEVQTKKSIFSDQE